MARRIATLLLILGTVLAYSATAAEPAGPAQGVGDQTLPQLPETEVIGEPPGVATAPAGPGDIAAHSVLAGTVFASPKATGYEANSSTTGTLVDVPNLSVPGSVDVVTEDLRSDQHALQFDDVLRDIGGAGKVNDDRRPDAFFLRGFLVTSRDYRKDGFLDPTYTPRDFADVERVEILKGPASMLYGAGEPCGVVNLITKKPLDQPMYDGGIQFGSFGLERYTIDATGPINRDKSLLYRINAAYQDAGSFRVFGFSERTFAAPSLAWVLDSDTTVVWEGEYVNDRRRYDTGVAAVNGQLILPINRFLGEPTNDFQQFHDYRQSLVLNHRINEDWAWKIGGYSLFYDAPSSATFPVAYVGSDIFLRSRQDIGPFQEQYQSLIANIAGTFEGGGVTHHVVFGTEEGWFTSDAFHATQTSPLNPTTPLPIDAMDPVYGLVPPNPPPAIVFDSTFYQADYGTYVQDLIDVGEHWKVLAGVRYDHAETTYDRSLEPVFGPVKTDQTFDEGTPRVGLIYEAIPEKLSYYALYSESFAPPVGLPEANTEPLLPEFGQIWEGGVKLLANKKLSVTAAGFYITKENVPQLLSNSFLVVQIGRQRSQGVEIEGARPTHRSLERVGQLRLHRYAPDRCKSSGVQRPARPLACPIIWATFGRVAIWCSAHSKPLVWPWA